jgi:hypothetical protein
MKSSILSQHRPAPAKSRNNPLLRYAALLILCCGLLPVTHAASGNGVDEALKARLRKINTMLTADIHRRAQRLVLKSGG